MTEHFAQGKFRRGLKCKQDLVLSHLRGVLYLHVPFRIESEFKNREFKQRYARQPEVDFFAILGRDFDQMFGQIDSVREKIRRNTNLLASRHIKGKRTHFRLTCVFQRRLCLRDGLLEKLWGGGIFERQEFCSLSNSLYEFFLGHSMNIFEGKISVQEFCSFNFPFHEYFFCTSPAPPHPHKFSNGPSLSSLITHHHHHLYLKTR